MSLAKFWPCKRCAQWVASDQGWSHVSASPRRRVRSSHCGFADGRQGNWGSCRNFMFLAGSARLSCSCGVRPSFLCFLLSSGHASGVQWVASNQGWSHCFRAVIVTTSAGPKFALRIRWWQTVQQRELCGLISSWPPSSEALRVVKFHRHFSNLSVQLESGRAYGPRLTDVSWYRTQE